MPEDMPEDMSEYMPEDMSDRMPEDMSEYMPEDMPDRMPEDMSDRVPEDMPDRMPEDLPDRMPEDMPEDMPDHMPEDMPDRMSNRMSEDMSDRMPEDLPVRKCINVMVGITRSKVIYFSIYWENNPKWLSYFSEGLKPPTRLEYTQPNQRAQHRSPIPEADLARAFLADQESQESQGPPDPPSGGLRSGMHIHEGDGSLVMFLLTGAKPYV